MIPTDKIQGPATFDWTAAHVKHCQNKSGGGTTTFFVSAGLYFVRPTEKGETDGIAMYKKPEFDAQFVVVEEPRTTSVHADTFERGFPTGPSFPRP